MKTSAPCAACCKPVIYRKQPFVTLATGADLHLGCYDAGYEAVFEIFNLCALAPSDRVKVTRIWLEGNMNEQMHRDAIARSLQAMGDAVAKVGPQKPVAGWSKDEALSVATAVVDGYRNAWSDLIGDGLPF